MTSINKNPIGIFDSGVGGISVLNTIEKCLPHEHLIYYADSAHAPYGTQSLKAVKSHVFRVVHILRQKQIKALVVACNTATSAAIQDLRTRLTIPVIGMEPALKPAVKAVTKGKIIVMATPLTLREKKFQNHMAHYQATADISLLPAPRLVEYVEQGKIQGAAVKEYLTDLLAPFEPATIAAIVLGCTHFIFIRHVLAKLVPPTTKIIDGNLGTARHLKNQLHKNCLLAPPSPGRVEIYTSGTEADRQICQSLYSWGKTNF